MKYEQIKSLEDEKFRRLTGVKNATFEKMTAMLQEAEIKKKAKGGRKRKLSIENRLLMALEYIREYRTYFHVSQSYGVSESTAYDIIKWIEETLIKHPDFALPGRKALLKSDIEYEVVLIDATETPIERPKKRRVKHKKRIKNRNNKQKQFYSGKKKRHTLKRQVVVDKKTRQIICTAFTKGKRHDLCYLRNRKQRYMEKLRVLQTLGIKAYKSFMPTLNCQKRRARRSS